MTVSLITSVLLIYLRGCLIFHLDNQRAISVIPRIDADVGNDEELSYLRDIDTRFVSRFKQPRARKSSPGTSNRDKSRVSSMPGPIAFDRWFRVVLRFKGNSPGSWASNGNG